MKKIKFRGKREDGRGWIYGDFCNYLFDGMEKTRPCIHIGNSGYIKNGFYEVLPETVGLFTGLFDKNGMEIYEGDIVRYYDDIEDELLSAPIIYDEPSCSFCAEPASQYKEAFGISIYWQFEVIGNIHDNPEILKGGDK